MAAHQLPHRGSGGRRRPQVSGCAYNLFELAIVIIIGAGSYCVAVLVSARLFSYREPANLVVMLKQR